MKKLFDEEDEELNHEEKAKILVTIIPFVLIILILAITLMVNGIRNNKAKEAGTEDLQQSIMDYADSNNEQEAEDIPTPEPTQQPAGERTPEPTPVKEEAEPSAAPTASPYKPAMSTNVDYSKVEYDKDEQLAEFMYYWEDGNQKALDDLANLERFLAMSWDLRGTKDFFYYGERNADGKPHGTGIAVYADNQYYYGGWSNGVRSGEGSWMHYHIHTTVNKTDLYTYHQYTGFWANDLPEGEGSEHYEYDMSLLKENIGYNTNLIGSYQKGLVHGEFYMTNIYSDGNMKEWYASAENGSWIYQSDTKDSMGRRPVQVEDRNPDNYIWMYPKDNKGIGVDCLISSNKN
ncbi:MAG: hypothetical protein IJ409_11760 [Lachnospiraceae bacterium]|nr:hypothetical protein [Lachnospiraceae bacterium]